MIFQGLHRFWASVDRRWWEEVTARGRKLKAEFGVVMTRAQTNAPLFGEHSNTKIYSIVQIIWLGKTLANQLFQSLTRKNINKFTTA